MRGFKRAIKRLGLTRDPREAGYILPDGSMLDFHGRALGSRGPPGYRQLDHSEVNKNRFRKKGAIRVSVSRGYEDISIDMGKRRMTQKQRAVIQAIFNQGQRSTGSNFRAYLTVHEKPNAYGVSGVAADKEMTFPHIRKIDMVLNKLLARRRRRR